METHGVGGNLFGYRTGVTSANCIAIVNSFDQALSDQERL